MKNIAVFATFRDRPHADAGVKELLDSGFPEEDISVLLAENIGTKDFAHERHSKGPEGAVLGGVVGVIVGGTLGVLAGLGMISVPAIAQYLASGPVMDALAGAGAVGFLGAIIGAIIGLGIPEFEAKRYRGLIKEGRSLLSVHCDSSDWVTRAKRVLKAVGGRGVVATGESSAGFAASTKPNLRYSVPNRRSV
ncbi:MAG: DUF3341 domain-containing protein [Ignavibacteriota bacterium]